MNDIQRTISRQDIGQLLTDVFPLEYKIYLRHTPTGPFLTSRGEQTPLPFYKTYCLYFLFSNDVLIGLYNCLNSGAFVAA